MTKKQRLDQIIMERGLAPSRTAAQGLIMAGKVRSGSKVLDKPGQAYADDIDIEVLEAPKYVSRGGNKLESIALEFGLDFKGKVVLDVGSSTGGFTDYALQHGAARVYAVDVGTNQLAYKLRQDARVVAMEQTDIRDVQLAAQPATPAAQSVIPMAQPTTPAAPSVIPIAQPATPAAQSVIPAQAGINSRSEPAMTEKKESREINLPKKADIAVIDVSFISLVKILPSVTELTSGPVVAMAKPQFEADKPTADKFKGVISDPKVRREILDGLEAAIKEDFNIIKSADSSVPGTRGNVERFYLLEAKR